jgi:Transposase DDE domain
MNSASKLAWKSRRNLMANSVPQTSFLELIESFSQTVKTMQPRQGSRDFSRKGPLSPTLLLTLILYMIADGTRRGYDLLLEAFWDEARSLGLPLPQEEAVSASSFCSARQKLRDNLFPALLHHVEVLMRKDFDHETRWHGRRVFAVDGCKTNVQRHWDLAQAFGVPKGAHCPQVLVSTLFDVGAKIPVDLRIDPFGTSERAHMLDMLPHLQKGDILVLDRGYPSHEVLQALTKAGIDFLIRVPSSNTFEAINLMKNIGGEDYRLWIEPPANCPPDWKPLRLRVIKLMNKKGETTFFITNLFRNQFSREDIRELYHMRWEEEEFYKMVKSSYIGQDQFRSKSPAGVRQEIHAQMLFLAMSRYLLVKAAAAAECEPDQLQQKGAVLTLADYVTRLFLQKDSDAILDTIERVLKRIARHPYHKRDGRSFPRRSFKPSSKWGAQGRRGG